MRRVWCKVGGIHWQLRVEVGYVVFVCSFSFCCLSGGYHVTSVLFVILQSVFVLSFMSVCS